VDERARNVGAPALPAGETPVAPIQELLQADGVCKERNPPTKLDGRHAVEACPDLQVLPDRQEVVQHRVLEDDADASPDLVVFRAHGVAVDADGPAVRRQHGAHGIDRRCLPGAVGAKEGKQGAFLHGEADSAHRRQRPVSLHEVPDLDHAAHSFLPIPQHRTSDLSLPAA